MAQPWAQVAANPAYQQLAPDQQEAARQQYFAQVVAPQISDPSQVQAAKAQFDAQTGQQAPAKLYNPADDNAGRYQVALQQNVEDLGPVGRFAAGFGKAFVDTGRGLAQLVGAESPQDVAASRQIDAPLESSVGGAAGNFTGQAAQMIALGGAGGAALKGASALGAAAPYVSSALASGAFAGAQPVAQDESRAANTVVGAGLGAAGQAIPAVLGAAAKKAAPIVSDVKQAAIDTAQKYGIPLHLSQVTDSKALQTLASSSKYLPFSGSTAARNAQQGAFNKAVLSQVGEDATNVSDPVLASAAQRISNGYNSLLSRNTVKLDPADVQKLADVTNAATRLAGKDAGEIVGNHVDDIVKNLDPSMSMPGRLYQALRTDQLLPSEQSASPAAKLYLKKVRNILEDAAQRSMGPEDAAELGKLNNQYKSLKIIQKAVNKRASGAGGDITPASLWSFVNGKYGSTPEMRDLARLGQTVLKDPIPDSGTAGRLLSYGALGGAAAAPHTVIPLAIGGATVGRALNSPAAARVLPKAGQNLLQGLSNASRPANRLLPLAAPAVAGNIVGNNRR